MESLLLQWGVSAAWANALEPDLFLRLCLAAILGGMLGLERERLGKPAGLRTNLLICIGAALFTELSLDLPAEEGRYGDPARIAAQIVSGIGFLGAGTILHARGRVTGLTTAATIWVAAAIGMAVGAQAYGRAIGATLLVLAALIFLGGLETRRLHRRTRRRYVVEMEAAEDGFVEVERLLRAQGLVVSPENVEKRGGRLRVTFDTTGPGSAHERVVSLLAALPPVRRVARKR